MRITSTGSGSNAAADAAADAAARTAFFDRSSAMPIPRFSMELMVKYGYGWVFDQSHTATLQRADMRRRGVIPPPGTQCTPDVCDEMHPAEWFRSKLKPEVWLCDRCYAAEPAV